MSRMRRPGPDKAERRRATCDAAGARSAAGPRSPREQWTRQTLQHRTRSIHNRLVDQARLHVVAKGRTPTARPARMREALLSVAAIVALVSLMGLLNLTAFRIHGPGADLMVVVALISAAAFWPSRRAGRPGG